MSARNYLVLGREAHARNAALTFGGAVHAGLETLLKGKEQLTNAKYAPEAKAHEWNPTWGDAFRDETDSEFSSRISQSILRHFTENPAPPDEYRTAQVAIEVLQHYQSKYHGPLASDHWTIQSDEKGALIERAFELPLGVIEVNEEIAMPWLSEDEWKTTGAGWNVNKGGRVVFVSHIHLAWSGRIDLIAECNGKVRVVDHKTTSIAGDQVIQDFILSNQTIGYVWAAQQLWPELDVSGFCVNFIHLKRPVGGKGFSQSLVERGVRGGEPPLSFFRSYFDYSPERIVWWQDNVRHMISDFIHSLIRNYFTSQTKWCFGKYGKCPYHDSCVEDNLVIRDSILMSDMYKEVVWNPVRDTDK